MQRPCFLIVNPTSGSYSPQMIELVMEKLEAGGLFPQLLLTTSADDAPLFARRICAEESEPLIIAGGGDGTINGVVNGLAPGRVTFGVLPLGTANVLARELGIVSVDDAVEKVKRQQTRPMSVGMLESGGESKYFLLMAGVGFDGAVVDGVRLTEKRRIGKGAYLLSALRVLANWDRQPFKMRIDGKETICHSAVVCNGAKYGGSYILAPEADIFSPGFEVVGVRDGKMRNYLKLVFALVFGKTPQGKGLFSFKARTVEIDGAKAVQVDGDYHCQGPLKITAVENFLEIIC